MAGMISDSNYEDDEYPIPRVDVVSSLLFSDKKKDVVIFGEGNFTFSIALAAARNTYFMVPLKLSIIATVGCDVSSHCDDFVDVCLAAVTSSTCWEGITVTYYESKDSKNDFAAAKAKNLVEIRNLAKKIMGCQSFFDLNYKIVSAVAPPPNSFLSIQYCIDATTTSIPSLTTKDVICFQCPWTSPREDIPKLIVGFMENMKEHQKTGQYLLIGICILFPYVTSYYLQDLGIFNNDSIIHGYHFFGGDTAAIGKLLHLGYRHEGLSDIHYKIFDHHVTLVFKKL